MENKTITSNMFNIILIFSLFGVFVLGAVLFNWHLTNEYENVTGAYSYVVRENMNLEKQIINLTLQNNQLEKLKTLNEFNLQINLTKCKKDLEYSNLIFTYYKEK